MSFPDLQMIKLRLEQIATVSAGEPMPEFLGAQWAAQDALYWLTGDVVYAERADEIAFRKSQ